MSAGGQPSCDLLAYGRSYALPLLRCIWILDLGSLSLEEDGNSWTYTAGQRNQIRGLVTFIFTDWNK